MIACYCQTHREEDNQLTRVDCSPLDKDQNKGEKMLSSTPTLCTSPKLIPLVLGPIFTVLHVLGISVPSLCRRIHIEQTIANEFSDLSQEHQFPWKVKHKQTYHLNGRHTAGLASGQQDDKCFERNVQDSNSIANVYHSEAVSTGSPFKEARNVCVFPNSSKQTIRHLACTSCRRKAIASKIVFVILVCLMAANILRYITFFIGRTEINEEVVTGVVVLSFFVGSFYGYLADNFSLSKYLPKYLETMYRYEIIFNTCLDIHALKKRVRFGIIISIVFQSLSAFTIAVCPFTFLPSFRRHLSPFDTWEGWPLYVMWTIICATMFLGAMNMSFMALFLLTNVYVIRKEFCQISKQMKKIFTTYEESIRCGSEMNEAEDGPNLCCQGNAPQCPLWDWKSQNGKTDITRSWSERDGKKKKRNKVTVTGQKCLKKSVFLKQRRSRHLPSEFNLPNSQKRKSEEPSSPCDVIQTFDRRFTRMEISFDRLRVQHEFMVRILEHSQRCISHLIGMGYLYGIPVFCIIIFGISGGSLQTDDAAFLFWIIVLTLLGISSVTTMGIFVNVKVSVSCIF